MDGFKNEIEWRGEIIEIEDHELSEEEEEEEEKTVCGSAVEDTPRKTKAERYKEYREKNRDKLHQKYKEKYVHHPRYYQKINFRKRNTGLKNISKRNNGTYRISITSKGFIGKEWRHNSQFEVTTIWRCSASLLRIPHYKPYPFRRCSARYAMSSLRFSLNPSLLERAQLRYKQNLIERALPK